MAACDVKNEDPLPTGKNWAGFRLSGLGRLIERSCHSTVALSCLFSTNIRRSPAGAGTEIRTKTRRSPDMDLSGSDEPWLLPGSPVLRP